jgi:transcriptional regulator with XRE-family HTH domain
VDLRTDIQEFLSSRRARITPEQAGLPVYGSHRRVKGLRREEVALLAGVSVDYYVRMERGGLAGASDGVLDALASALRLDEAERDHLFRLARRSGASGEARRSGASGEAGRSGGARRRRPAGAVRATLQQVLDAVSAAPAWVCNGRYDVLGTNRLARALFSPVLAEPRRPANTARFVYLMPEAARDFFVDYDRIAVDVAAKLRLEAGRDPHDEELIALVGELSTRSELFRQRWASQDVRLRRSGRKRLHHPVVGRLDLDVETLELPGEPGLHLSVYTAPVDTPAADNLALLASWAATGLEARPGDPCDDTA